MEAPKAKILAPLWWTSCWFSMMPARLLGWHKIWLGASVVTQASPCFNMVALSLVHLELIGMASSFTLANSAFTAGSMTHSQMAQPMVIVKPWKWKAVEDWFWWPWAFIWYLGQTCMVCLNCYNGVSQHFVLTALGLTLGHSTQLHIPNMDTWKCFKHCVLTRATSKTNTKHWVLTTSTFFT